jgi:hypothetical protein
MTIGAPPLVRHGNFISLVLPGLLIFTLALIIRFYFTYSIGDAGDEFVKWYQNKRVLQGLGWDRLDHHTVRWSLNTPALIVQWLLGNNASIYYITPAFFGAVAALFVFLITRLIAGTTTAVFAAFLFSVAPPVAKAGSQFLPAIFTCAYVLGSAYFVLRFTESSPRQNRWLVLSALFLFFAYGTKVPNLFFLPGIVIFLWWRSRPFLQPTILFFAILLGLYILETIGLALFTGNFVWSGRLHYLGFHMDRMMGETHVYHLSDIWQRWLMLPAYWQWLLVSACVAGAIGWFKRESGRNYAMMLIFAMLLSFSLLTTFAIVDFEPLRFVQPLRIRYLTVTIPLAVIVLCCGLQLLHIVLVPVAVILFCWPWATHNYAAQLRSDWVPAVLRANGYQKMISDYWRNDYALLFKGAKHSRLYRAAYLDDDILFKSDGSVERIGRISSAKFDIPTKIPILFVMSRTENPVGYLELTRAQEIHRKKTFNQ